MNMTQEEKTSLPSKRLALFFDGTWNEPGDNTNVWRLFLMLADRDGRGVEQRRFYDQGVGTHWYDRITGGAFGAGLSENIRVGYRWLMEHYNDGDEIFLFGFSRGAFTARSLAGLIARCGILKPDAPMSFTQVFERYQKGKTVDPIYHLIYLKSRGKEDFDFEEKVLLDHAWYHRDLIKMVGVWDTVGSIGVALGNVKGFSRRTLRFHNTHLSTIVQRSYQALALDEQRKPYWAVLWTHYVPDEPDTNQTSHEDRRIVEQRWFSGAHANVGGGYRYDLLPQRPLGWIQRKASESGLAFRSYLNMTDNEELKILPRDSYAEFLGGWWKILTLGYRHIRWVQSEPVRKASGWVETVNERIDRSVFDRCQRHPNYRPASLVEWAKRKKLDLKDIIANPDKYPQYWSSLNTHGIETAIPAVRLRR
jgi:uncharacterized protein (DUF2235 family)